MFPAKKPPRRSKGATTASAEAAEPRDRPIAPPTAAASAPKRRKVEEARGNASSGSDAHGDASRSPADLPMQADVAGVDHRAKMFAVAQAQREGCLGNYRSFDSPHGNFLVPVIPSRSDLFGS